MPILKRGILSAHLFNDMHSENMNSRVRSSRSAGYLAMTAVARQFTVIFRTITSLIMTVSVDLVGIHDGVITF